MVNQDAIVHSWRTKPEMLAYGDEETAALCVALELGATKEQIMAVLQLVSAIGIHTLSLGAPILREELAAHAAGQ